MISRVPVCRSCVAHPGQGADPFPTASLTQPRRCSTPQGTRPRSRPGPKARETLRHGSEQGVPGAKGRTGGDLQGAPGSSRHENRLTRRALHLGPGMRGWGHVGHRGRPAGRRDRVTDPDRSPGPQGRISCDGAHGTYRTFRLCRPEKACPGMCERWFPESRLQTRADSRCRWQGTRTVTPPAVLGTLGGGVRGTPPRRC